MRSTLNYVKTGILFAALTALLVAIGYIIAGRTGAIFFLLISFIINFISYWFSDRIALSMAGAQPLLEQDAPDVYKDIRDLVAIMDLPMPKIYVSDQPQPNAFATGRNKEHSAVCITKGLLQILNRDEIKGVLAHELSHVKNNDVLISTIAAVIAGAISSIVNIAFWFGGSNDKENTNPFAGILLLILAPISATLLQLAISRSREYAADISGAEYTKKPQDLANALVKIENAANQIPMNVNPSLSSLYIQNPLRTEGFKELFSTHPSTANRVAKLIQLEGELDHK